MSEDTQALPEYRCNKKVCAIKIKDIAVNIHGDGVIIPAIIGYSAIDITVEYIAKHNPQIGGYYVVYKDGYRSFSPAAAFEEGYVLIDRR